MDRDRQLLCNTAASLLYQGTALVCGFVLPRYFLRAYGSRVCGLMASVNQLLGLIGLAEGGFGAVVQSALYGPLSRGDREEAGGIFRQAECFFRRLAAGFLLYGGVLALLYPLAVPSVPGYRDTALLVLILSLTTLYRYGLERPGALLLEADCRGALLSLTGAAALILHTGLCLWLMDRGWGVHGVQLAGGLVFLLRAAVLRGLAARRFPGGKQSPKALLSRRWEGFSQHLAAAVLGGSDLLLLTLGSTLEAVSVYSVYSMVTRGLQQLFLAAAGPVQPVLGKLAASRDRALGRVFEETEWLVHMGAVFAFTCGGLLITSFVGVYTAGLTDARYHVPVFGWLLCLGQCWYCFRLPANMLVLAAGHYSQTRRSCWVEMALNLGLSVLLLPRFGLAGVAFGTLAAMVYRTLWLEGYLSRTLLPGCRKSFRKLLLADGCTAALILLSGLWVEPEAADFSRWALHGVQTALWAAGATALVQWCFYRDRLKAWARRVLKRKRGI